MIDRPIGQKIHLTPTPLMGGAAVYVAFAFAAIVTVPLSPPVVGVLAGGGAAVLIGILDELYNLPPLVHLGGQVVAASVALICGLHTISTLSIPDAAFNAPGYALPLWAGVGLTLFWLVGMMNTVNFLDGLDGLAAGVVAIAALLLAAWAWESSRYALPGMPNHEDLILPLGLAGALLGFLPFYWHRARIFLCDSGSMFLGLGLGALAIIGPAKLGTALLILLIPVLDVAWAIVRRRLRGRSFLSGDKQHVYHRMLELGLGYQRTVIILYSMCVALAALDLLVAKLLKLAAFIVLAALLLGGFVVLELRASRRTDASAEGMPLARPIE
ncbi:MAG: MraY family glycosyltransferase [Chloroflexota bacterium]